MLTRLLLLVQLLFLSQALAQRPVATSRSPETCAVTKPSRTSLFVPPAPYDPSTPNDSFYFGTDKLWTILRADAIWPRGEKTFWWREDWSPHKWIPQEDTLKFRVTARRLDEIAQPARVFKANSSRIGRNSVLIGGIEFPTSGCWEITAHYEEDELGFVVWVAN
jgi:hypothetical protein